MICKNCNRLNRKFFKFKNDLGNSISYDVCISCFSKFNKIDKYNYYKNIRKINSFFNFKFTFRVNINRIKRSIKKLELKIDKTKLNSQTYYKGWDLDSIRKYRNDFTRNKRQNNNLFKLSGNIRNLIGISIKKNGYSKKSKIHKIIGCSFEELKIYIESKFESWMTWENYGRYNKTLNYGWDIDHIIPLSSADSEEILLKLNHYTNLQPLDSRVNRDIKINKIKYEII